MTLVKPESITPYEQTVRDAFEAHQAGFPAWLQVLRADAMACFNEMGFPTRRDEAYKYLNLRPLLATPYQALYNDARVPSTTVIDALIADHLLPESQNSRLVFVDGVFSPGHSTEHSKGVSTHDIHICNLANVLEEAESVVRPLLGEAVSLEKDPFAELNLALFQDGAFVHVPAGRDAGPIVQVLFISTQPPGVPSVAYPRSLFVVEPGAKLRLVVQYVGQNADAYFVNAVHQFEVAENAELECEFIQKENPSAWNISASHARVQANAKFSLTSIALDGHLLRHGIQVCLDGEGAECHLDGLNVLTGEAEVSNFTIINHNQPNCVSRQYYKGVLDDRSKSSFNGTIVVAEGAQGTDSQQLNKNLMLSDDARAYTRPQLLISADDVKCAHGATVGQLQEDQLFYLASRGIDHELAEDILTYGFAEEIVQHLPLASLREYLDGWIFKNLGSPAALLGAEAAREGARV